MSITLNSARLQEAAKYRAAPFGSLMNTMSLIALRTSFAAACLAVVLSTPAHSEQQVSFIRDIRPILSENCFFCHGPDEKQRKGELRLDTRQGAGGVLIPGDSAKSELFQRITNDDPDEMMPPPESKRKLTAEQIALLRRWIDRGATWGEHWAFTKPKKRDVPSMTQQSPGIIRNPIDNFVQRRLAKTNLKPSPEASRPALIRRVSLDLTGLPPTFAEVEAFLKDTDADAYEKVVDRLLQSPAFGQRMAWDWLDAARYADSNGYQGDADRTMWPWRDWVVKAFNRNLPYEQFTTWQLAGDLLPTATFEQQLATGFCRNHMINGEGGRIAEENRVDYVMDMTETTGTIWLGLTLTCARCHDHKYDPVTRREYYQLFAFFNQTPVNGVGRSGQSAPTLTAPTAEQEKQLADMEKRHRVLDELLERRAAELAREQVVWEKQISVTGEPKPTLGRIEKTLADVLKILPARRNKAQAVQVTTAHRASDDAYNKLQAQSKQLSARLDRLRKSLAKVMIMQDMPKPRKTFMLDRGLYNKPGEEVTATVPEILPALAGDGPVNRLSLARWLVSPDNPLTSRVTVNRFWQQIFGIGLVKTTEDFGTQGEIPLHMDLLDWLAADFRDGGWDVKRLLRLIVTSHTYRQSSKVYGEIVRLDPDNRMLARGPRFRMPSWMLRDQALAVSGLLNSRQGGPPVNGYQPPGVWEDATFGKRQYHQEHGDALYRRSLYTFWRRIIGPTMFFDSASRQTCTVKVFRTNTPLHALLTLNDVTYVEAARALAELALISGGTDNRQQLDFVFLRVLARPASDKEQTILLAGLKRTRDQFAENPDAVRKLLSVGESKRKESVDAIQHASWTALCLAILNFDETLTKQ